MTLPSKSTGASQTKKIILRVTGVMQMYTICLHERWQNNLVIFYLQTDTYINSTTPKSVIQPHFEDKQAFSDCTCYPQAVIQYRR